MASALAQQLAALQASKGPQERFTRGKASLLFDYQKAADVSAETLLGIARQGLERLCRADNRFSPFADSLFGRASLAVTREQLTKEQAAELDAKLSAFLRVLANHFLSPAAFQALEYCVRRYKVHVYNVGDLLLCALPYHATPEFARLVSLLQLKGTPWEWLEPCQKAGAPPPRQLLVQRCANDMAALREVCRGAQQLGAAGFVSKTYLSFYAVTLCEVLLAVPAVTEDLLTALLPFVVAGLGEEAARDYRAATLMALTQLLARAQLARDFLAVVATEVVRGSGDLGASTSLMLLAHLAATQASLTTLPARVLQLLADQEDTTGLLEALQARGANLAPLLRLLLRSLAQALPAHAALLPLLEALLHGGVAVEEGHARAAALHLLQAGARLQQEGADAQHVRRALGVFDLRYADQLDEAINDALRQAAGSAAAAAATVPPAVGSKAHKHSGKRAKQPAAGADATFEFVQACFSSSRHEVLPAAPADGAGRQQQQALTLSLAVAAPASEMRLMALQKLDAICAQPDAPASTRQLLSASLLGCLRDDVAAVAAAAASAAGLASVPAKQQLPALQYALSRTAEQLAAGSAPPAAHSRGGDAAAAPPPPPHSGGKEALAAAKALLAATAAAGERAGGGTAADSEDRAAAAAVQRQAAALLLECALADKRSKKLARAAVAACCRCSWHPLLQALADAPAVAAALQPGGDAAAASSDGKRRKKGSGEAPDAEGKHAHVLALNRAVVQAIADALGTGDGGGALLAEVSALAASGGPRCRHLLLLVLAKAAGDSAAGGGGAPPTPARGTKGRGRQHRASSSQVAAESAGAQELVAALLGLLQQQLRGADAAGGGKPLKGSGPLLPPDWRDTAGAALDDSFLPTKQHLQQLHSELPRLHAALLLAALREALLAAPAEGLGAPTAQLFSRLAGAAAAAPGGLEGSGLLDHLQLLVAKSAQAPEQQLRFLSGLYGLPTSTAGEPTQAAALKLLCHRAGAGTEALAGAGAGAAEDSSAWFVQLLAAADSSNARVRAAAVGVLLALPGVAAAGWALAGGFDREQLGTLVSALQPHAAFLLDSPDALAPLLAGALSASVAEAEGGSQGRRSTRGKAAASKAAGADGDAAAAAEELHLQPRCAHALQQLLLATLPQLWREPELLAAQLAASLLLAAGAGDPGVAGATAHEALQQLLRALCAAAAPPGTAVSSDAVTAARPLWQELAAARGEAAASEAAAELRRLRTEAAAAMVRFFTPDALREAQGGAASAGLVELLQLPWGGTVAAGLGELSNAQLAALAPVREAALQQLTAESFAALAPGQQQEAFAAALRTHASDGDAGCRAAARAALQRLPVTAGMVLQLLLRAGAAQPQQQPAQTPRAKRSRRASSSSQGAQPAEAEGAGGGPVLASDLDTATAALELLQWKDDVQHREQLLQPLLSLLQRLTPLMGSIAESHREGEAEPEDAAGGSGKEPAAAPAAPASAAAAGYAAQLVLLALEQLARQHAASAAAIDPALVLGCAAAAPDGAVRNAALQLLAVLAERSPEEVLSHMLQALSVIHESAALQQDSHSQAVAAAALRALVPPWLAAGRGSEELWESLLASLPGLPASRRLRLLESLLVALPEDAGLPVGLLLMMRRVAAASAPRRAGAAAEAATPPPKKGAKRQKQQQPGVPAAEPAPAEAGSGEADWLPDLMAALCEKVPAPQRLRAYASVLESSLAAGGRPLPAYEPLPRLAVTFVTANLKSKSVLSAAAQAAPAPDGDGQGGEPPGAAVQAACRAIMAQALRHLQQLSPAGASGAAAPAGAARRQQRAIRAAAGGVYALLAALEGVQDCPSYLRALVDMSRQPSDSVQRRALRLLAARLLKAAADLADLEADAAAARAGGAAPAAAAATQELASAGLAVCGELPRLLRSESALARQLALVAADAAVRQLGAVAPALVLEAVPVAASTAARDASPPVRVSALALLTAAVRAVGPRLVPLLPEVAAVVLDAAEAACRDLSGHTHAQQGEAAAAAAAAGAAEQPGGGGGGGSDSEDDGDAEQPGGGEGRRAAGEDAALQLAAALAALEALFAGLGAMLSPYLDRALRLLLHRQTLGCSTAGAAAAAARLRAALPSRVPPRLLVAPLVAQWNHALASCAGGAGGSAGASAEPPVALLQLAGALASSMDPAAAATYHEALAGLLLRALDTRQRWLASQQQQQQQQQGPAAGGGGDGDAAAAELGPAGVHAVESAAVAALSALVMKLSERSFKPLFLRLVDWANAGERAASAAAGGEGEGGASQGLGRAAAFMAAVVALGHRLRAVFCPYHRYYAAALAGHLASGAAAAGGGASKADVRRKKKHKRARAADGDGGDADGGGGGPEAQAAALCGWLARLRAVRAVHLLALHEPRAEAGAAAQEQQERFDRLVPLVVGQLAEAPPLGVAAALAEQGADAALDLPGGPLAALGAAGTAADEAGAGAAAAAAADAVGAAALGALLQVAAAAGSDAVWKPLHHALLIASRTGTGPRPKLLALGGVSRLAELLREEYLLLLPEALPFVAELIEDGDVAVEAAAQGLVAQLEALSGERLEQYLKV